MEKEKPSKQNLLLIQFSSPTTTPTKQENHWKKQFSNSNDEANPGDPSHIVKMTQEQRTHTTMDSWIGNIKDV